MEFIYLFILLVYLPVLITGQYTLRGVPESYGVLGENYRLQCDVTDSPSLVEFRRNNIAVCSILSQSCESNPTDNIYKCGCINNNNKQLYLNISNINKQDDTTWSCRGNDGGQGSTTVPVYYGPENTRFNPTGDNIDVIEGKSQSVNCLADCKPDCNINWSKDGSTTTLNNPLSLSTRDQTGSYTCTVTHTVLNKQQTKQLNVHMYYGPGELTFSPDVTSINIIESRDQTITCLTDCYECNYKWTGPVSSSTKDLALTQIKRNQEGSYKCEATNVKNTNPKTRSKSLQVNVYYPPDITSITSNAVNNETDEGSDVIFNCNVDSKPASTITWSSSTSTDTYTGQQWTLTQAKCQDTGIYTCTSNNGVGQSTTKSLPLNVRCSPRINFVLKDEVKNRQGEEETLVIDVIAYPKPSFKWIQESTGQELTPDPSQQVSTNNYISRITLTLQQSSFGNYIVTVTNDIGDTNYTIKIIDGDPPDITSITSNAVNNETDEGSDVIFNCNVDSKPASTITWSSSTSTDTYTGQQWTLTQAKCQDTGIYTCTSNNGIGQSTTKSLPLNVRCSPRINFVLKDEVKNRLGEEETLVIDVIAYPKPSFKWIQESTGQELTPDPSQQVSTNNYISRLTLTLQQSSFGNFIVTVTNDIGDKNYTIKIIDGDPPDITSLTSNAVNNETDEGSDVIFNCNVDSKPASTITWSSSTSTDTYTGQQWTLTQAKCQDTGIYTCTSNNGIGQSTTKSLPLNVRCSPRINFVLKDEVKNRLGEEETLVIDVIAYPKPSFKWIQESTGQELTPDPSQQVSTNNYISRLTLTLQQSSFGNYIVTVTNDIGDTNYTIKIIDGDPPDITSITSNAVNNETDEGSDVIFNCNVDSKPASTITWSSSTSTDTYTGQQWTLTQAKCQDTGIYTCTSNNGIGQSTTKSLPLNVRCSPRINFVLKDEVKNRLGEEVTLVIDVIAYPKPSFKWIQESTGQELTPDPSQQVSTNNYISRLTLTLQQSSFGNYIVTVTNDIGDKNYTIKIIDGDPSQTPAPQSELNIPAVVGGIIAAVVVITLVIVAVIVIKRRK